MLSPLNTPLYTSGASLGRKYLYDLYNNPTKNDLLTNAVKKYFKDMKYFENSCELIEHGSPATYNFNAHSFVLVDMLIDSHTCENSDMAKARRDYVIHCIGNLANRLFSTNDPGMVAKTLCVKKYLTKKILKHGSFDCEKNYIEMGDPRLMSKGEKSLNKFLNKILENKLLSDEEKIQKRNQKGKSSNPYDNVIETPLISSEQALKNSKEKETVKVSKQEIWSAKTFDQEITAIVSEILQHMVYSEEGQKLKQRLVLELVDISRVVQKKKDIKELKLQAIFSKDVNNRFPDMVYIKLQQIANHFLEEYKYEPEGQHFKKAQEPEKKQEPDEIPLDKIKQNDELKEKDQKGKVSEVGKKTSQPSTYSRFVSGVKQFFLMIGNWLLNLWNWLFN